MARSDAPPPGVDRAAPSGSRSRRRASGRGRASRLPPAPPAAGRALRGLLDGTIDAIATDHAPHSDYEKELQFMNAPFGVIGFESAFPVLYTTFVKNDKIKLEELIERMTSKPADIIHKAVGVLKEGAAADLNIFDLGSSFTFGESEILSKSKNSPFLGMKMWGKIHYTICDGKFTWKI